MGIKGTGNYIRIIASEEAKMKLARKLVPIDNVAPKYSLSTGVQLGLPLSDKLGIPQTLKSMKGMFGKYLGENEIKILRYVMRTTITALKYGMYTGQLYSLVAFSSSVMSPYLWDVYKDWLLSCKLSFQEDIRETVLIQDSYNQGSGRYKIVYGVKVFWSKSSEENVDILERMGVGLGIKNGYDLEEII